MPDTPAATPAIDPRPAGRDYIGVGVGAFILNDAGQVFLAQRGPKARNERGLWEIPGGAVEWGETLEAALKRETKEEYGIDIEIIELLHVCDHIMLDEGQHWISPTYLCKIVAGEPGICEPGKAVKIGWFSFTEAKKLPLSQITKKDIEVWQHKFDIL